LTAAPVALATSVFTEPAAFAESIPQPDPAQTLPEQPAIAIMAALAVIAAYAA